MTSPRWIVIDDANSTIITYKGPWFRDSGIQHSVGNFGPPYGNTLHGTKNNASLSFSFYGTRVRVMGTNSIRNDSGVLDPTWDCFVDNISIGPTTPFQFTENNWVFCDQEKLVDGPHVLTVNATVATGQTFWFDDIQYVPSANVPLDHAAVMIDSLDSQLQYGSGWQALGNTANMTSTTNSKFTFSFIGQSLSWYGFIPQEFPHNATASNYSIDGGESVYFLLHGLPSNTTATTYNQKFFETANMPAGRHNLVVTYLGNSQTTPLTLDYLIVQNGTTTNSGGSTAGKSTKIGAIVGGILGGVLLIAIAIFAFLYIRRRRLSEEHTQAEPKAIIDPFPLTLVSSSMVSPTSLNPSSGVVPKYSNLQVQSGNTYGSMPSFSNTNSISPPGSSSSGSTRPNPLQPLRNHGHVPPSGDSSTVPGMTSSPLHNTTSSGPYQPTVDKAEMEAAAIASTLRPQRGAQQPQASPPLLDDSGSRIILHEDSGIRLARNEPRVVEVPPVYTPG